MENNLKIKKSWKKLLLKYFDFDNSGKIDWWEIFIVIIVIFLFDALAGIIANIITK